MKFQVLNIDTGVLASTMGPGQWAIGLNGDIQGHLIFCSMLGLVNLNSARFVNWNMARVRILARGTTIDMTI